MNFLAHIHLSSIDNELLMLGNFMGDFVKGNQFDKFPLSVQKGVLLHRHIDSFTDNHPIIKDIKHIFKPLYGRYSGVITDIVLDHFLSAHWNQFSCYDRLWFISRFYTVLTKHQTLLPTELQRLVPSLIHNQWVMCYASFYGLQKVLHRMERRTSLPPFSVEAIDLLRNHYSEIDTLFLKFYPDLCDAVAEWQKTK